MKKIISLSLTILLSLFIVSCSNNNRPNNSLKEYNLYGKVKTIKQTDYTVVIIAGALEKGSKKGTSAVRTFDRNGNLVDYHHPESFDFLGWGYKYDSDNNLIEKYAYYSDNTLQWKEVYVYDDKNKLLEIQKYDMEGEMYEKTIKEYNLKDLLIKETCYDIDIEMIITSLTLYFYNEMSFLTDKKVFDGNMNLKNYYEYLYNNENELLAEGFFDKNGNLLNIESFEYHTNGMIAKKEMVNHKDKTVIKYNESGNHIETKLYDIDDNLEIHSIFKHDNYNNLISFIRYWRVDNEMKLENNETHDYVFDSKGNWIKRVSFYNNKPNEISIREITYY